MTTSAWRIALLAVLLLPTRSFAEHQSFEIESLRIIIDTDWPGMGAQGYFPVRMDITNLGDVREIEILVTGNRWIDPYRHGVRVRSMFGGGLQSGRTDLRQILRLKRGDRLRFTMPLPVFADSERFQIRFRENGRYLDTPNSFSFQSGRGLGETPVLLAVNPSSQLGLRALGWPRPVPYTGYRGGIITTGSGITVRGSTVMPPSGGPRLDYTLSPERLPTNWLGFTSLRAVLLGPAEWQQLNAAQQDALLTWTASGGDLLFVDGTLDALLPPGQTAVGVGDSESVRPYFLGNIHLLNSIEIENVGFPTTIDSLNSAVATPDWSLPAARASDWGYIGRAVRKIGRAHV